MDTFFENTPKLSMYRRVEHSWPTHFHINIEIFIVKKGSYEVSRNGEYFTLTENQIAFSTTMIYTRIITRAQSATTA